jgi:hypothetical protein
MPRSARVLLVLSLLSLPLFAQQPPRPDPPASNRCCNTRVYDRNDQLIGDVIRWDDRFPTIPLQGIVRYRLPKIGDEVAIVVSPDSITGLQEPGGSVALFTTPDCSGTTMFVQLHWPPLMKRYAMVLRAGPPGTVHFYPTNAWLWVTDAFPSRVHPGATVFHSQWGDNGACVPYPAPGYTVAPSPFGGYWMKRVEDLLAKYKRPFYSRQ